MYRCTLRSKKATVGVRVLRGWEATEGVVDAEVNECVTILSLKKVSARNYLSNAEMAVALGESIWVESRIVHKLGIKRMAKFYQMKDG